MAREHLRPPWKPGQSGNPSGKPKQLLTKDKLRGLLDRFMRMTKEELIELSKSPKTPMIELAVASILAKCVETGDYSRLEALLQRHMGKVADEIVMPKPMVIRRPSGEQLELTTQQVEGDENE